MAAGGLLVAAPQHIVAVRPVKAEFITVHQQVSAPQQDLLQRPLNLLNEKHFMLNLAS